MPSMTSYLAKLKLKRRKAKTKERNRSPRPPSMANIKHTLLFIFILLSNVCKMTKTNTSTRNKIDGY